MIGMLLFAFFGGVYSREVKAATSVEVSTQAELKKYLNSSTEYTIQLKKAIYIDATIKVNGKKVINGNGYTIWRDYSFESGRLLQINSGGALTLNNVNISGSSGNVTSEYGLIRIVSGGTLTMNTGSELRYSSSAKSGGGVHVAGQFIMNGGLIHHMHTIGVGAGVHVSSGGTFTMKGGKIYSNKTEVEGGGVAISEGGTFTFTGGSIESNKALEGKGIFHDGKLNLSGTASVHSNNSLFIAKGKYIALGDWTSPSPIQLDAEVAPETIMVSNIKNKAAYFSWSSLFTPRNDYPLCVMNNNLYMGKYYNITLDNNRGDNTYTTLQKLFGETVTLTTTTSRVGYDWNGWYTAKTGGSQVKEVSANKNLALYAQWTAKKYTVKFTTQYGTVSQASKSVTYDSTYGTLPTPVREGYLFGGWYSQEMNAVVTSATKVSLYKDHVLTAKWSAGSCTVTFNANGGSTSQASKRVTYDSTYGTLPVPTRNGYVFKGWSTNQEGGNTILATSVVKNAGDHSLYAQWEPMNMIVSFWVDGGTTCDPITVIYDSAYGILPQPHKDGYTFGGWYTGRTEGTLCDSSTIVKKAEAHTLYARWNPMNYTVTLDMNGGKEKNQTKQVSYKGTYGELPTPTRDGYSFYGWFCYETYGLRYTKDSIVQFMKDHTLYARWNPNKYNITFSPEGGTVVSGTKVVTYDANIGDLETPKRTGYDFVGWYTGKITGDKYTGTTVVKFTKDITLYARWMKSKTEQPIPTTVPDATEAPSKRSVSSFKVTGLRTTNYVNTKLDTKHVKLQVKYSDGSSKTVSSGYTIKSYSTKVGKRNVTFSYGGKTSKISCSWFDEAAIRKINLKTPNKTLYVGEVYKISLQSPYPLHQVISYKSSNKSVATVNSSGILTAKKAGKAVVTITVKIGAKKKTRKLTVNVKKPCIITEYDFGSTWNTLLFTATVKGSKQKVVWSCSNTSIASINKKTGVFVAKKEGTVIVTAKAGNLKKQIKVHVLLKEKQLIVY